MERWENWTSHGWPVCIHYAVSRTCPDPYCGSLIDLPGCMVQGRTINEVLLRLDEIVPWFIDNLTSFDVSLPTPSKSNGFACESIEWIGCCEHT